MRDWILELRDNANEYFDVSIIKPEWQISMTDVYMMLNTLREHNKTELIKMIESVTSEPFIITDDIEYVSLFVCDYPEYIRYCPNEFWIKLSVQSLLTLAKHRNLIFDNCIDWEKIPYQVVEAWIFRHPDILLEIDMDRYSLKGEDWNKAVRRFGISQEFLQTNWYETIHEQEIQKKLTN